MNDKFQSYSSPHQDNAPVRVCMIAYTNYVFDGRVRLEAESLAERGYEVLFLVTKQHSKPSTYSLAGVTVKELNVRKYNAKSKVRYLLSYLWFLILAFLTCTQLFFQLRFRVVHVHNMPDVLVLAALVPRMFGCKVILDLHDTIPETYEAKFGSSSGWVLKLLRLQERLCCWIATQVICVNHVQREAVARRGISGEKIATVITMPRFTSQPRSQDTSPAQKAFRMVNHGTISKRLGNDLIITAAARLAMEIPGFELHIIGGGDNLEQVKALARSLRIEDHIVFQKSVPWNELPTLLSNMDVGIVANRINAATELMLPLKLIDYVVLGIPAIVPRLRTIEYYFSDEMVCYFTPGSIESLEAAVLGLYRNRDRRLRQAGRARSFVDEYRWEGQKNGIKCVYDRLLGQIEGIS
jgi:glycosyltransferase involved in cell wall biosynthesis